MYESIFKRTLDLTLCLIAFVVLSPFFIIVAVLIKIESPGPVLFKQKRVGRDAQHFHIYKLRTMKRDAPDLSTEEIDQDLYTTKMGRLLRKRSLDELPQLLNIIKGEMAIVGPRPVLFTEYELTEMRNEKNIHSIRPGLTGYAQIEGRDMIENNEKVAYDLHYLNELSFALDAKIIWRTMIIVAKGDGNQG